MAPGDSIAVTGPGPGTPAAAPAGRDAALAWAVATAALVMLIIQAGLVLKGNAPVLNGVLIDPDSYMRLARVEHLWATGAWFDPVFPRIGPPEGLALHWTRPFDVLLLAGALIASPLLGFKAGLYWWGAFLGPVLQVRLPWPRWSGPPRRSCAGPGCACSRSSTLASHPSSPCSRSAVRTITACRSCSLSC